MIAREWRCLCPRDTREGFLDHLRATGVAECSALPGFLGARILERDADDGRVEVALVTEWTDMEAVRAFAGPEPERARLYPGDEAFRIEPGLTVAHWRVLPTDRA